MVREPCWSCCKPAGGDLDFLREAVAVLAEMEAEVAEQAGAA